MEVAVGSRVCLELKGVKHIYGKRGKGVRDLSFSIERGERVGLLGLNGAGKSTTFRLIAGLLLPQAGSMAVAGHDLSEQTQRAREVMGYLPENAPLPLELTVLQVLELECELRGLSCRAAEQKNRLASLVQDCELSEVLKVPIRQLSRGFRKRVALACSLVHSPQLLLLDEPTAGLDPHQVDQFRRLIAKVSEHCATLISTHVLAEVEAICQRCLMLHEGELKADLPLPIASEGWYEAELQGACRGDLQSLRHVEYTELEDAWTRVRFQLPEGLSPEAWTNEMVQSGRSLRMIRPLVKRLEEIFLERTQPEQGSVASESVTQAGGPL